MEEREKVMEAGRARSGMIGNHLRVLCGLEHHINSHVCSNQSIFSKYSHIFEGLNNVFKDKKLQNCMYL